MHLDDRVRVIYEWASRLTRESEHYDPYYWTEQAKRILFKMQNSKGCILAITGLQGIGKTSCLYSIESAIRKELSDKKAILATKFPPTAIPDNYRDELNCLKDRKQVILHAMRNKDLRYLLIDLRDYSRTNKHSLIRDLDYISTLWNIRVDAMNDHHLNMAIFLQEEFFIDRVPHFFLGKAEKIRLEPLTSEELFNAYISRFNDTYPFDADAILRVAILSRGIFRRFKRYIQICIENAQRVRASDVDRILIKSGIWMHDMNIDLCNIFKSDQRAEYASRMLLLLMDNDGLSQKEIASRLGVYEAMISRICEPMERYKIIDILRGSRGNIVRLRSNICLQ